MSEHVWWKESVVYQIYTRSFQDTTGDGVGDIQGIIKRLPYIKSLGIGCIVISPVYPSPDGESITDFKTIDPRFGTMTDIEELIDEVHRLNMHILLDMVIGRTSNEHPWFLQSKKDKTNAYKDYYLWSDEKSNWKSRTSGDSFSWNAERKQFYVHSFRQGQPDLNWRNGEVKKEMLSILRFWLDKGIDGFRLDAVNCIVKDETFRDNPSASGFQTYDKQLHIFDRNRPENHKDIVEFRNLLDEYPDRLLVGEIVTEKKGEIEMVSSYQGSELHLAFDNSMMRLPFKRSSWQRYADRIYASAGNDNWPAWVLNNQDVERSIDRFGGSVLKAKLAALYLMTQKGTPFLYYGEELGLKDTKIPHAEKKNSGIGKKEERGPMVWNLSPFFGFSAKEPWVPFCVDAEKCCVSNEELAYQSMLSFYRQIIWLRNDDEVLKYGSITYLTRHGAVMQYERDLCSQKRLILLNFSNRNHNVTVPACYKKRLLTTYLPVEEKSGTVVLAPWQGVVYTT
jgi:alpha-glucosidase